MASVKHPALLALEQTSPEALVAELRVLATLVHDGTELVQAGARIPSSAWERWARRARAALKHAVVKDARRVP